MALGKLTHNIGVVYHDPKRNHPEWITTNMHRECCGYDTAKHVVSLETLQADSEKHMRVARLLHQTTCQHRPMGKELQRRLRATGPTAVCEG